jgi:hypothetical protein
MFHLFQIVVRGRNFFHLTVGKAGCVLEVCRNWGKKVEIRGTRTCLNDGCNPTSFASLQIGVVEGLFVSTLRKP